MRRLVFCLLLTPIFALADGLTLTDAWSRATPPGSTTGAVYGVLSNEGDTPVTLGEISSPVANMAHLHTTRMDGGMMRMRQADGMTIAPGERVVLEPGSFHIMLMGVEQGLTEGQSISIEVGADNGPPARAMVRVGGMGQMGPP